MKKYSYMIFMIMFLTSCCTHSTCIVTRAWNGAYSRENTHKEMEKKRKEYYENEPYEKKQLRRKNQEVCDKLSRFIFKKTKKEEPEKIINMSDLYMDCMRDRGTPEI
ncbi:hypothetical protein [Peptostreptococcus porci]|uniref:hypothetical protein n=1 Tax=Peptostreptococcus porci TaxID=2652282 RepID=UPI002A806C06|nr:hypothetical protein [Peptostreptococcus porci]MDY4127837.1 hypothetical protein [Peptostreptococcus porci]